MQANAKRPLKAHSEAKCCRRRRMKEKGAAEGAGGGGSKEVELAGGREADSNE